MMLEKLKGMFADGEYPDAIHVVVTNTETKQRTEIEDIWVDSDGVLNIITTGRSAGEMDENLMSEVFDETN